MLSSNCYIHVFGALKLAINVPLLGFCGKCRVVELPGLIAALRLVCIGIYFKVLHQSASCMTAEASVKSIHYRVACKQLPGLCKRYTTSICTAV